MSEPQLGADYERWWAGMSGRLPKGIDPTKARALTMLAWAEARREYLVARPPVGRLRYTVHNLLGHPLMEVLHILGCRRGAWIVHEKTLPRAVRGKPIRLAVEAGEYFYRMP